MSDKIEKWVEDALKADLDIHLRNDFKDRVMKTIKRKEKSSQRKLYFWMVLGVVLILGCGVFVSSAFAPSLFNGLENIDQVVPMAVVIGVAIAAIQYLDKKLVKDRLLGS